MTKDKELMRWAKQWNVPYALIASLAEIVPPNETREAFIRKRLAAYGIKVSPHD